MNHRSRSLWASPVDWRIHPCEEPEPARTNPRPDPMILPRDHPETDSARGSSPGRRSPRDVSVSPRSGPARIREVERRVYWAPAPA